MQTLGSSGLLEPPDVAFRALHHWKCVCWGRIGIVQEQKTCNWCPVIELMAASDSFHLPVILVHLYPALVLCISPCGDNDWWDVLGSKFPAPVVLQTNGITLSHNTTYNPLADVEKENPSDLASFRQDARSSIFLSFVWLSHKPETPKASLRLTCPGVGR